MNQTDYKEKSLACCATSKQRLYKVINKFNKFTNLKSRQLSRLSNYQKALIIGRYPSLKQYLWNECTKPERNSKSKTFENIKFILSVTAKF